MTRDTVGKISSELLNKVDDVVTPTEQMRENLTDYERTVYETLAQGKKEYTGDFFLVVLTKKERLMPNVLRNYFFTRLTCPTPDYDQVVYRYISSDDMLEFIWVIPSKEACVYLKENAINIPESERDILTFVLDFADGLLYKRAKILNGESADSNELKKE